MRTFIDDVAGTVMEIVASPAPCGLREQGASGEELQPAKQASKNEQKKESPPDAKYRASAPLRAVRVAP